MSHHLAYPRVPVIQIPVGVIPEHYFEVLEQNQQVASCCRHPEEHEIEAWYSSEADRDKGLPDIYVFHCTCGRQHRRFCIGGGDERPRW